MWAWIGVFLDAAFRVTMTDLAAAERLAAYATFAVIAVGAVGCVVAGYAADRLGRTTVAMAALAVSGACTVLVGLSFGAHPIFVTGLCLLWGVTINADSAQFSASVAELADARWVGSALTLQTSLGFLLTLATIQVIPWVIEIVGWRFAFATLAPGPVLGILAMQRLRRRHEAARLAGGRG